MAVKILHLSSTAASECTHEFAPLDYVATVWSKLKTYMLFACRASVVVLSDTVAAIVE